MDEIARAQRVARTGHAVDRIRAIASLALALAVSTGCAAPSQDPSSEARRASGVSAATPATASEAANCDSAEAGLGTTPAQAGLGASFTSGHLSANGTDLHYVRGGSGPALILLHGFPQDWSEWRHVMPELAKVLTVIAVDLRGIGGSKPTRSGYDAANLAADIHALARGLGLERPYIAGHDIGGMVAYAYARAFPDAARGVMVLDVPLPGIEPWSEIRREPLLWHFHFHQTPALPETLVGGQQAAYFRDFVDRLGGNPRLFSDDDITRFAAAYGTPCSLRAGFEFYRAFPAIATWNESRTEKLSVPIVLAAGEKATAQSMPASAADLRRKGALRVMTETIAGSGHYVVEEKPAEVTALIVRYAAADGGPAGRNRQGALGGEVHHPLRHRSDNRRDAQM